MVIMGRVRERGTYTTDTSTNIAFCCDVVVIAMTTKLMIPGSHTVSDDHHYIHLILGMRQPLCRTEYKSVLAYSILSLLEIEICVKHLTKII